MMSNETYTCEACKRTQRSGIPCNCPFDYCNADGCSEEAVNVRPTFQSVVYFCDTHAISWDTTAQGGVA